MFRDLMALIFVAAVAVPCAAQTGNAHEISPEPYRRLLGAKGTMSETERLEALAAEFKRQQGREPLVSRDFGGERAMWRSRSQAHLAQERKADEALLAAVRSIEVTSLSVPARLDHLVLEHAAASMAAGVFRNDDLWPTFHRVRPPFGTIPNPPKTTRDYQDLLAWLRGVPHFLEETRGMLQSAMAAGVVAERGYTLAALEDMEAATPAAAEQSPTWLRSRRYRLNSPQRSRRYAKKHSRSTALESCPPTMRTGSSCGRCTCRKGAQAAA